MDAARQWVEKKDSQAFEVELNGVIEPLGKRMALTIETACTDDPP